MYYKNCPTCDKQQTYSWKISFDKAVKNNTVCTSCAQRLANKIKPQCQKGFKNIKNIGKNNPMYGKSIYDIWNKKYDKETADILIKQHKQRSRNVGKKNGMYGKSWKETIIKKYGIEKAENIFEKHKAYNNRKRGKDNPSYGKPANKMSGRGIKGYIDGIFFRSLLEMQYIYNRLQNGDDIQSAENSKYRTKYIDKNGKTKTYHPDFVINSKIIVEVKPSSFLERNKEKIEAGKNKFKENYVVETEKTFSFLIDRNLAKELLECDRLKFINTDLKRGLDHVRRLGYIQKGYI